MVEINSNYEKTVWWHTALHVVLFPFVFVALVMLLGLILYFLGRFNDVFAFIVRALQFGFCANFALILPTFFLSKSNEVVASTIVATVGLTFIIMSIFATFTFGNEGNYTKYQWLEIVASQIGFMVGVIAYYFGERG